MKIVLSLLMLSLFVGPIHGVHAATQADAPALPLRFELNEGQSAAPVRYFARGRGYTAFLTDTALTLRSHQQNRSSVLRITPVGGRPLSERRWESLGDARHAVHYVTLSRPNHPQVAQDFAQVRQIGVWRGIDMLWHPSASGELEYDLEISPGAAPDQIEFSLAGVDALRVLENGSLAIEMDGHQWQQRAPIAWQDTADGTRENVAARYVLAGQTGYKLDLSDYDRSRALTIDPVILYASYLGGTSPVANDGTTINAVVTNAAGEVFVAGTTYCVDFPVLGGDLTHGGEPLTDGFVAKFSAGGGTLIWASFIGEAPSADGTFEYANDLAVDSNGRVYVAGSQNLIEKHNAFLLRVNPGTPLTFQADIFGGNAAPSPFIDGDDQAKAVAVDAAGNVFVVGRTTSPDFPITVNALDPTYSEDGDGFIRRYNANFVVTTSTYFSFAGNDFIVGAAVGGGQNLTVAGTIFFDNTDSAVYAARFNNAATATQWFLPHDGDGLDIATDLRLDANGRAFVVGTTNSEDFATGSNPPPLDNNFASALDGFLMVAKADGTGVDTVTYLGGADIEIVRSVRITPTGEVQLAGTRSQTGVSGSEDMFVLRLNAALTGTTGPTKYLGTPGALDVANGLALAPDGSYYVVGRTGGTLRTSIGAFQPTRPGSSINGVMLRLREGLPAISVADVTVTEGTGGTRVASFHIRIDGLNLDTVTVNYSTVPGTATSPADFTATSGSVTFDTVGNSLERVVNVSIVTDSLPEPNESFRFLLSNPIASVISDGDATGTITNDDVNALPDLVFAHRFE